MPTTILSKYRYRRRLPHLQKADCDLFITFCTLGRITLPEQARDMVLQHALREGGVIPFAGEGGLSSFAGEGARATRTSTTPARATLAPRVYLHAVVVMPDHVHLLLKPLRDTSGWPFALVDILQCMKSVTARQINKLLGKSGPVWEDESFDHVLRSGETLKEKAEYIRQNPVGAGLVRRPEEYRWLWVNPELEI